MNQELRDKLNSIAESLKDNVSGGTKNLAGYMTSDLLRNEGYVEAWEKQALKTEANGEVLVIFTLPQKNDALVSLPPSDIIMKIDALIEEYKNNNP